jgi:D-beta-D-heptose 7-phosphate kinase / D-beta-D-heptose 1-phosphate adenosyltransferase
VRSAESKIGGIDTVAARVAKARAAGQKIALAAARCELLHVGLVRHLEAALALADVLVVALLAEETTATVADAERALLVAALRCVDHVVVTHLTDMPDLLRRLRPDVYCPSGDDPAEAAVVEGEGGRVVRLGDPDSEARALLVRLRQ